MIYIAVVLGIFLLDFNIKAYTDKHRLQGTQDKFFGGRLILRNYHNSNGAFGVFKKKPKLGKDCSAAALLWVTLEFFKALFFGARALVKLGLAFTLGGGSSNFYDRKTKGYVTDYFSLGVKNRKLKSMVFNLSDIFIFGGVLLYFIGGCITSFGKKKK